MSLPNQPVSYHPISDIQFAGLHLIEASAGTGKTYTLSSLMVRIFLEAYLPHQVIATTFTRAAAAELKSRIRLRVQETYRYLDARRGLTQNEILTEAAQQADPLLKQTLTHFSTQIGYACERLKLVLDQLDELFVGTLDSFSQKLLREFAFESGKIERAEITDDAKSYTRQLIHDVLREWIQSQPQDVIDGLYLAGYLKDVDHFVKLVEDALNFSSAQFKVPDLPELNFSQLDDLKTVVRTIDLSHLAEYFALDGTYYAHINGTVFRHQAFNVLFVEHLPQLLNVLSGPEPILFFEQSLVASREAVFKFLQLFDQKKIFKKCPVEIADAFYEHATVQQIQQVFTLLQADAQKLEQLQVFLKAYLCTEVKKRLPQVLQQKGETTFAQQIRTLADALKGEQGQRFASYVHARYPLILVDEFQDTNQDQDDMLASIWRHPERMNKGCMIMVGDRKQAIYGFRGGDMLTFLNAYHDIQAKQGREYKLVYNHRSVATLVEVVDALFQRQPHFGEQVVYDPIQAGTRPHPSLIDHGQTNPYPLRWVELLDKDSEAQQVAWKIKALLNQTQSGQLYLKDHEQIQALSENDFAVLSRNHDGLDKVQYQLERLGIRVNRPSRRSVFDTAIAQDVAAFLTALLHPYDETKLKRALLSRLFSIHLKQLLEIEQQAEGLSAYMMQFDQLRELWMTQGFMVAWQGALSQFQIWQNLVQVQSKDNERVVVNLRHLTEILSQHSEHYTGAQHLYDWYMKQLQSPMDREWELERKLSSDAGVQLMTIHQSKGLEFKMVFLLGADKPFREMQKTLNFSMQQMKNASTPKVQRVVSIADKQQLTETELSQHEERAQAEQNRLWYVALTRASHRVYAMMHDPDKKSNSGLAYWKNQDDEFNHPSAIIEPLLELMPLSLNPEKDEEKLAITALNRPEQRFYPRAKTSFTSLAQHLSHRQKMTDYMANAPTVYEPAEDETTSIDFEHMAQVPSPIAWIKQHFPKGTMAGSFLHELFEHIDFQDSTEWVAEIRRRFKNTYSSLWNTLWLAFQRDFPEHDEHMLYQSIAQWLFDVVKTPLHHGFQINQLSSGQYLSECPFYLSLSDRVLAVQRIHQLLQEYLEIDLPVFVEAKSARYLTGSIDLMYFDGQRYHIADYKSNYLGDDLSDYGSESLKQNMSFSSYWLQAVIYLVVLHRYLSCKLMDYQIEKHLGGASYLYLRGMDGQAQQGVYYWKPADELILRLDAILGRFSEDKSEDFSGLN